MQGKQQGRRQRGFTLIEIMVVVVIIGILAALVGPNILGKTDQARVTAAKVELKKLREAIELYKMENYRYPTTDQGLEALVKQSPEVKNWPQGGYLGSNEVPLDPWGNPYLYIAPGTDMPYDLVSLGADGKEGGEGNDADLDAFGQ
ncbi:MAG: type II secretion system major pseudopilin GspG [Pseudomonadota bacterium]